MRRSVLEHARGLLRRRKFEKCLAILEPAADFYRDSFEYHMTMGLASLYLEDNGNANASFQKARQIRVTDPVLLLAQAALFLRCKDSKRAVEYYLDVLEHDPRNKLARKALDFIRSKGTDEEILRLIDTGDIKRFYPPLGVNPAAVMRAAVCAVLGVCLALAVISVRSADIKFPWSKPDSYYEVLRLKKSDVNLALERNLEAGAEAGRYVFQTNEEMFRVLHKIEGFLNAGSDNLARVEINRVLNSNANDKTKLHVRETALALINATEPVLGDYIPGTNGRSKEQNFTLAEVSENPYLYADCLVLWTGRIANPVLRGNAYECDLLVGNKAGKTGFDGVAHVRFAEKPEPLPEIERDITVFGRIKIDGGQLVIEGINATNHVLAR